MLNKISFFQLDNLIKNRVPFTLMNMGTDISEWYMSLYKDHLSRNQVMTTKDSLMSDMESKNMSKDAAIVLLCQDGSSSADYYTQLEKNGYTNVYVIDGGYQQMMTERSNS